MKKYIKLLSIVVFIVIISVLLLYPFQIKYYENFKIISSELAEERATIMTELIHSQLNMSYDDFILKMSDPEFVIVKRNIINTYNKTVSFYITSQEDGHAYYIYIKNGKVVGYKNDAFPGVYNIDLDYLFSY